MKLKTTAILLCVLILFTAACGGGDTEPEASPPPSPSASPAQSAEPSDNAGDIDYDAAFEAFSADTVMFSFDGLDITWELLFYFLSYEIESAIYWNGSLPDWAEETDGLTYGEWVLSSAVDGALTYKSVEKLALDRGVSLTETALKDLRLEREYAVESFGSEEAFVQSLKESRVTESVYNYLMSVQYLYAELLTDLYGDGGSELSDSDAAAAAEGQDWLMAKHILLSTRRENEDGTYTDFTEEETAAVLEQAESLIEQMRLYNGSDFDAFFDGLAGEYSEDPGSIYSYPDGYLFTAGNMMEEFEQGTRDLKIGEFSPAPVKTIYGYHIIYRLPLDFDAIPISDNLSLREITAYTLLNARCDEVKTAGQLVDSPEFESLDIAQIYKTV